MLTPEQALNLVNDLEGKVSLLYDQICDPRHGMLRHYGKEENDELHQLVGSVGISLEELGTELKRLDEDLKRLGFTEEAMREQLFLDHEAALKIWMDSHDEAAAPGND